ncbi:MAG: creatininase family protein, partial [Lentisphaeria bacterium]|nr:creatininase family protein [Lentisphaeria bacterium]
MVDYTDTARDWALSRSDLIFLPVGSLEQHGDHLPINSDCRIAEYFSRK